MSDGTPNNLPIDLLTITETGLYELSYSVIVTSPYPPVNGGTINVVFYTTDEAGKSKYNVLSNFSVDQPRRSPASAPIVFSAVAGTPISLLVQLLNKVANPTWILRVAIKRVA